MGMKWFGLVIGFLLLVADTGAATDIRYVSDVLVVTLRAGQGDNYEVLRSLRSNTPVEVIEENDEYLKVKTQEGDVGWVRKRYFTTKIPIADINAKLEKEIEQLKAAMEKIKAEKDAIGNKWEDVRQEQSANTTDMKGVIGNQNEEIAKLKTELEQSRSEYQTLLSHSGQVADLMEKSRAANDTIEKMTQENAQLSSRMGKLQEENKRLLRFGMIRWFVAGSVVLLIGLIIGKMSRKKSYY